MVNTEHERILLQGKCKWNRWRDKNPTIIPNLVGTDLTNRDLRGINLSAADLRGADMRGADLRRADLRGADLANTNVGNVRFNRWARYRGIKIDGCFGDARFKRLAQDQDFIEEFRRAWWRYPGYLAWLILADCGRSLPLWAAWSISTAVIFGLKFYSLGQESFELENLLWSKSAMLYYSVVTFTTLGFGDITPQTQEAAWWVMGEVILGYIMLGGLITILATKLTRRS